MKVNKRCGNTLDSINASLCQFICNNGYAPSHIFMTREVWKDVAEDSLTHGLGLYANKPSQNLRIMGLDSKIIEGDTYEYYLAFCGT